MLGNDVKKFFKKNWKVFGKGWYKNKFSLYFSSSESENKPGMQIRCWVLWWMNGKGMWNSFKICWLIGKRTFSPWIENGIRFANHERKSKKKKKRFQKFVILWLHLLENHTIVAKIISLFVEKKLPLEYLRWKKLLDEKQKEMSFMKATFPVLWKTFVEKDF